MLEATSSAEIVGKPVKDFLAPEYRDSFRSLNDAVFRGESLISEFDIIGLSEEGRFLPKPFSIGDLTRKLRDLLDGTEA